MTMWDDSSHKFDPMGKLWETKMHRGSHWKPPHQTSNVSNDQVLSPAVSSSLGSVEGLVTQTLKTFLSPFIPTSATLLVKQGRIVSHGVSITTGLCWGDFGLSGLLHPHARFSCLLYTNFEMLFWNVLMIIGDSHILKFMHLVGLEKFNSDY